MGLWIGFLYIGDRWQPQPSTRSRDMGTCARRLNVLAEAAGVPAIHQIMTGGKEPTVVPPERRAPSGEAGPELEGDEP